MPHRQLRDTEGRTKGAYRYLDTNLKVMHTTSVPPNDERAIEYVTLVDKWFAGSGRKVRFIEQRGLLETTYVFMKVEIIDGEAVRHGDNT